MTTRDRDGAKLTFPPPQRFWVKNKQSGSTEAEAQEHDSQLKQRCQQPKGHQSCRILMLPLRASEMLSGDKQRLRFLCLDPLTFPVDMIRKEPSGLHFGALLPVALPTSLVLICIFFKIFTFGHASCLAGS